MQFRVKFLDNEYFWGGPTCAGTGMPICEKSSYNADFTRAMPNQFTSVFLSSKGRYVWTDRPFKVCIESGELCFEGENFELYENGNCLRDAYLAAMRAHFPFEDKMLPREFFKTAQYNTWMEFTYEPTQDGVLEYADNILKHGFEPGILMIDEGWQNYYGNWKFAKERFPDPKAMVDKLHSLGFKVMLWVTPFVTADGADFAKSLFKEINPKWYKTQYSRNKDGRVALYRWWNGTSAALDLTKESDRAFLDEKLSFLIDNYGVDGFKFDGGSYHLYHSRNVVNGPMPDDYDPVALNLAWNEYGTKYEYHEFKDTYNGGGKAVIQRLCDRSHAWEGGADTLVPCALLQGLMGYPYVCPDMIGGGSWIYNFYDNFEVDGELFVRMAQTSALFPMMQFSWAPWRVLSQEHFDIVKQAARLHNSMADEIIRLIEKTAKDGEPVIRLLEYNHPHNNYEIVTDQFMLGRDILVCPVTTKGTFEKDIIFPEGRWSDCDGNEYTGPATVRLSTPIEKLLWFRRI